MNIINGKEIAKEIEEELKNKIIKNKLSPTLAIIKVGDNPASDIYVRNKIKACDRIGIKTILYDNIKNEEELIQTIKELNLDTNINGILVQSPLPDGFNENKIIRFISETKDVDGFGALNMGYLARNEEATIAATPYGIIKLLEHENIEIEGKHVVIVGRSNIVGRPLALAMLNRNATVTICHTKTQNLSNITKTADILVIAIGQAKFITKEYIKENAIVIDVGINRIDNKIVGDVDFLDVSEKVSYITPVPGGVGPMTIVMLLNNVIENAMRR